MSTGVGGAERFYENRDFYVRRLFVNNVLFDVSASEMVTGQNTLSTVPSLIVAAAARRFLEITNDDGTIKVYIGNDSSVSSVNGHVLKPGASLALDQFSGAVWAVAASGTPLITYAEW